MAAPVNESVAATITTTANSLTTQEKIAGPKAQDQLSKPDQTPKNVEADYKASLEKLAGIYDQDVKTLAEKITTLQGLLDQGIVSRLEVEKAQQDLIQAEAKAKDAHDQIASADKLFAKNTEAKTIMIGGPSSVDWTTGNAKTDSFIKQYSTLYGVDPYLVYCVIDQESGFSLRATSGKGAQGLMQLMPDTAARYGVTNPYDAEQNIKAGTHYLKDLLAMFDGNSQLALAGYNAGEGAVMKYGNKIPPYSETRNYVKSISAHYSAGIKQASKYKTVAAAENANAADKSTDNK